MEISGRQLLNAGITTAITLGDPIELLRVRDRVNKGELTGSRIFTAGRMLVQRRTGAPAGRLDDMRFTYPVDTAEDIARVVNELADAGVDLIKVQNGFRALHYRAAVDAAHQRGLKVHAHVYTEDEVREAFEAGVDVLQHVGSGGTSPPYTTDRPPHRAGRPPRRRHNRAPLMGGPSHRGIPRTAPGPAVEVGAQIYHEVQDSFKNWHTLGYFNRIDSELFFREQVAKQWIESGAILGLGTDSGTPMNFHTEALWREMKAHVDMGMPASRVIAAATRINATRIRGRTDIGTIEPGKLADLIVVVGNPLHDMTALSHVQIVVKNGVVYKGGSAKPAAGKSSQ